MSQMGSIDTMNADNIISVQTKLFGLIAEHAQTNRLFVLTNRLIKNRQSNAMIIPMNIREDDFYFTLSNMKKSHVNGAYIAAEYQESAVELLEKSDTLVKLAQRCDFVLREGETLEGFYLLPLAIKAYIQTLGASKIAIVGSNGLAKALAYVLDDCELSFYDPQIEAIMQMATDLGKELDINRIDHDMKNDFSSFDLLIDTDDLDLYHEATLFPKTALKPFLEHSESGWMGYEALLEPLSTLLFENYIKD